MVINTILPETPSSPFDELLGTKVLEYSAERVVVELPVTERLCQTYGIVHGGVYASLTETAASIGAVMALGGKGGAVGISNATDFLHPVRDGTLRAEATPVSVGRSLQLWQVHVTDSNGRTVAHSKVKLYNLHPRGKGGGHSLGGDAAASAPR